MLHTRFYHELRRSEWRGERGATPRALGIFGGADLLNPLRGRRPRLRPHGHFRVRFQAINVSATKASAIKRLENRQMKAGRSKGAGSHRYKAGGEFYWLGRFVFGTQLVVPNYDASNPVHMWTGLNRQELCGLTTQECSNSTIPLWNTSSVGLSSSSARLV